MILATEDDGLRQNLPVRVCVCAIGSSPDNLAKRDYFLRVARSDSVGEHQFEADPARADALLSVDVHQHYDDPLLTSVRRHPLARRYMDKTFVYDERDVPIFTFPGIYVSASPRSLHRRSMVGGPYDHVLNRVAPATEPPDLLYSFQGADVHPLRATILGLSHPRGVVRDNDGVDFFRQQETDPAILHQARHEYAELVRRSKFVLCPRGRGPTSFRMYETMRAGRVPVVISDTWAAPPRVDWNRCIIRVAQKDARDIPAILERAEDRWPELAAAVQDEYRRHLAPDRLWHHYCTSIGELARQSPRRGAPWWMQEEIARVGVRRVRRVVSARR
jgi:Exostosin family